MYVLYTVYSTVVLNFFGLRNLYMEHCVQWTYNEAYKDWTIDIHAHIQLVLSCTQSVMYIVQSCIQLVMHTVVA